MSLFSNLPFLRNYVFLRNKTAEHSSQISKIHKTLFNLEKIGTQNAAALEELAHKQQKLEELHIQIKQDEENLHNLVKKLKTQLEENIARETELLKKNISGKFGVEPTIHPEDHIYNFVREHVRFQGNIEAALEYYFSTGSESAAKLSELKNKAGLYGRQTLLEFASGYGCVSRHLKRLPEEFDVTACDIHADAVNFIRNELKTKCIGSVSDPSDFRLSEKFRIVFALSFFSHMPRRTWGRWLKALFDTVEPGGCIIFTTHGNISHQKMISHAKIDSTGFWFNENSEQSDLDTAEYGTTITTPAFVREEIRKLEGAQEVEFCEGFWWTHQDAWVVRKTH